MSVPIPPQAARRDKEKKYITIGLISFELFCVSLSIELERSLQKCFYLVFYATSVLMILFLLSLQVETHKNNFKKSPYNL